MQDEKTVYLKRPRDSNRKGQTRQRGRARAQRPRSYLYLFLDAPTRTLGTREEERSRSNDAASSAVPQRKPSAGVGSPKLG